MKVDQNITLVSETMKENKSNLSSKSLLKRRNKNKH